MSTSYNIIVVDDGSIDESMEKIRLCQQQSSSIKLIKLSRRFGKEMALTAGLDHSRAEVAILIDSDFQHPIDLLPVFLKHWADGFDMVYGIRSNRRIESPLKRYLTSLFYKSMQRVTQVNIVANAGDFRLLDQKVVNSLTSCHERGRFMKGFVCVGWIQKFRSSF